MHARRRCRQSECAAISALEFVIKQAQTVPIVYFISNTLLMNEISWIVTQMRLLLGACRTKGEAILPGRGAPGIMPHESFCPFHLYSMKQAIKERFILDMLTTHGKQDTLPP